ncbi:serine/threonine-protein phosphatase [Nocardia uniformis]|uniref:Serine/threonine-protein phosphatase n=1 Tax=Nocardia uniformis TaxID=53432 RepID=A0A849C291_9NOCA|nr:serine/threonine-protein phosphatase [Nocardia uniformis]
MGFTLRSAARSHRGLIRGNNEDSMFAGARLLALADGMGGHTGGEVASAMMIAALAPLDDAPIADPRTALAAALAAGNAAIAEKVSTAPDLAGMGTTLTALLFSGNRFGLAHVGDSRAYLLRDGTLSRLTRDDTFVQSLVDAGYITAERATTHPRRSLIMQALTGAEVAPTLTVRDTSFGDRYLLCSDGLSDVVDDDTLAATLSEHGIDACADRLIELALAAGGPDNITVVVAELIAATPPQ